MKQILCVLLCAFALSCYGTDLTNVRRYYDNVHKAELAIVDSQLDRALLSYQAAFSEMYPQPRDVYNAFVVAYILKDSIKAKDCFNTLIEMGVRKEKLEILPFFEKAKDDYLYLSFVSKWHEYFEMKYYMSSRPHTAHILDSVMTVDQFYRIYKSDAASISKDKRNIEFLILFSKEHGFPGFTQSGTRLLNMELPIYEGNLSLIFWHSRGNISPLDSIMTKAVIKGEYDPINYAMTMDTKGAGYYQLLIEPNNPLKKNDQLDNILKSREKLEALNKKRAEIYLDPLQDYLRKMNFFYTHENYFFFTDAFVESVNRPFFK